jgi:hypothetical protein
MSISFLKNRNRSLIAVPAVLLAGAVLAATGSNTAATTWRHKTPADTTRKDTVKYTEYKSLPLKPERKIAFATNEGTWMSVDVSPD